MNNKKWIKQTSIIALVILLTVGLFNYIVDPFQIYRKSTLYPFWYGGIKNERFHNEGLLKNYDYNSVVIGSSMVENFLISDIEKLVKKPIKLCMSGARAYEIFTTLNSAFKQHKKIKNVILGLDVYAITGDIKQIRKNTTFPFYLYDKNIFNDIKYILSFNTLSESYEALIWKKNSKDKILYQYEHMYEWQYHDENKFGKEKVLKVWHNRKSSYNTKEWKVNKMSKSFDSNILSIIKGHPKTKFYIFYPPYSKLAYVEWNNQKVLNNILKTKKYIYEKLAKCSNVELYDFQVATKITMNLNNYKDSQHYHQKINSWMIDQILNKKFQVTNQNIKLYLNILKKEANNKIRKQDAI